LFFLVDNSPYPHSLELAKLNKKWNIREYVYCLIAKQTVYFCGEI